MDPRSGDSWVPSFDLAETEKAYLIILEVPGVQQDNVQVKVDKQMLRITGKRYEFLPPGPKRLHHVEIDRGSFRRVLPLPSDVDVENISAKLKDGFLTVTVPKATTSSGVVKIETGE